jgi:hypothetical protein
MKLENRRAEQVCPDGGLAPVGVGEVLGKRSRRMNIRKIVSVETTPGI